MERKLGQPQSKGMFRVRVWVPSEIVVVKLISSQTSKSPLFINQKQKSHTAVTYQPGTHHTLEPRGNS